MSRGQSRERRRDGRTVYRCSLCDGAEVLSYRSHALGTQHRENVREYDEQMARAQRERIEEEREETNPQQEVQDNMDNEEDEDTYDIQADLDAMGAAARFLLPNESSDINLNDEIGLDDLIDAELENILRNEDTVTFDGLADEDDRDNDPVENSRWFPFRNKMELAGSLLIGHTHSLISRLIYNKVRVVITICDIRLPAWATVRSARARIRKLLQSELKSEKSPFGTPCFSLSVKGISSQH
ncbi:hypothetical protein PGT21_018913 [Puccinia graminis f. sp. tritici]|uniref:U1-type domain-containing protein n=1 Tax=Puccinia graminis f. sp. tritici TaxID=56615 RepID=A0A5B0LJX4_PUCGR|nr:hypothetical protein PGT21_018913 [Puccinia graminis f. sp. tritici]